jgi:stage III sporulation protein SpoIIIAA
VPHACIGDSRRVMVPSREAQAALLVRTVQNHTPQVVIVDEIGTEAEAAAIKTITQRGVVVIATAHGAHAWLPWPRPWCRRPVRRSPLAAD